MALFLAQLLLLYTVAIAVIFLRREVAKLSFRLKVASVSPGLRQFDRLSGRITVLAIVCLFLSMLLVFSAAPASAQTLSASPAVFGTKALPIARTPLDGRWQSAKQAGLGVSDSGVATLISQNRTAGRDEQLAAINSWVNGRIKYTSDQANYGQADVWATAARSLQSGRGDCEDYAIAKFQILRSLGVAERDMFLVVGRDRSVRSDHAVLVVRVGTKYRVLDNFTNKVVDDFQMIDFLPTFSYGSSGSWLHGFAAAN